MLYLSGNPLPGLCFLRWSVYRVFVFVLQFLNRIATVPWAALTLVWISWLDGAICERANLNVADEWRLTELGLDEFWDEWREISTDEDVIALNVEVNGLRQRKGNCLWCVPIYSDNFLILLISHNFLSVQVSFLSFYDGLISWLSRVCTRPFLSNLIRIILNQDRFCKKLFLTWGRTVIPQPPRLAQAEVGNWKRDSLRRLNCISLNEDSNQPGLHKGFVRGGSGPVRDRPRH